MSVYQLIYQSLARQPFSTAQLTAQLRRWRLRNHAARITGLLLYTDDGHRVLQVLEGDEAAVRRLYYDKIASDPRHHYCQVLREGPTPRRSFPDWGMGFRAAAGTDLQRIAGYFDLEDGSFLMPRAHNLPSDVLLLLLRFVAEYDEAPWREEPAA